MSILPGSDSMMMDMVTPEPNPISIKEEEIFLKEEEILIEDFDDLVDFWKTEVDSDE